MSLYTNRFLSGESYLSNVRNSIHSAACFIDRSSQTEEDISDKAFP